MVFSVAEALRIDKGYLRGALHFGTLIHNYDSCYCIL